MKTNTFFNKWWLMLVQGLLLILLSYFLFTQPKAVITVFCSIVGFIALLTGCVALVGYFLSGKNEKNRIELGAGFFSCMAGLFFVSGVALASQMTTWFFAAYMIFNALMLVTTGWHLKSEIQWWWIGVVLLAYTFLVLYFFISGTTFFEVAIAVYAGVQFFINGMLVIVLAFVVRKLQTEYDMTISQLHNQKES